LRSISVLEKKENKLDSSSTYKKETAKTLAAAKAVEKPITQIFCGQRRNEQTSKIFKRESRPF
jgi:hypothetical protein